MRKEEENRRWCIEEKVEIEGQVKCEEGGGEKEVMD